MRKRHAKDHKWQRLSRLQSKQGRGGGEGQISWVKNWVMSDLMQFFFSQTIIICIFCFFWENVSKLKSRQEKIPRWDKKDLSHFLKCQKYNDKHTIAFGCIKKKRIHPFTLKKLFHHCTAHAGGGRVPAYLNCLSGPNLLAPLGTIALH